MSGDAGGLAGVLALLALCQLAPSAMAAAPDADRSAKPARQAAPLREPRAVHERLRAICQEAGFRRADDRACAESITRACRRAGLAPDTARCWQWLVDRDTGGTLDRRSLKSTAGRGPSRN